MFTRKEIRRRFYLKHKDRVMQWVQSWKDRNKEKANDHHRRASKKYRLNNLEKVKLRQKRSRRRYRHKTIINHKWFCHIHKLWIGEEYDCPDCEII